ncbi:arsenate reductase ArsC [Stratiformator vulcanicus]|uniref:Arsenate-mycothiol transferase ArsC1 n=1 Tax=Stratiformator vulcanicus TaxID=2527980 RepID=A0A517QZC1_9PLAN|nr:arsenate reductase ArsC [Stratiformator vulcanicus]QDT36981.1 Arsenate-mycothiol transferase ArsC1 [Stratiformator vulcanicus]
MADQRGRPRVLFLCTGNSCRSQMAEGWARSLLDSDIDACSAGVDPNKLNTLAVKVMDEAGIDISAHESKAIDACEPDTIDLVVTVCGHADETCPTFPGKTTIVHRPFDDPPKLAADAKSEDEALPIYRRVRDEIKSFVEGLPALLREHGLQQ